MNYQKIADLMQRNDPNGYYNAADCEENVWVYLDILQAWYYDLKATNERVPVWLVYSIQWLDSVAK